MTKDMNDMQYGYVPITPGGTIITHLARDTEEQAWNALIKEAAHMPYKTKENFIKRGYEVCMFEDSTEED